MTSHRAGGASRRAGGTSHRADAPSPQAGAPSRRADAPSRRADAPTRRSMASRRADAPSRRADAPTRRSGDASRRSGEPGRRAAAPAEDAGAVGRRSAGRADSGSAHEARGTGRRARSSAHQAGGQQATSLAVSSAQAAAPTLTIGSGDLALSLPSETGTFSAVGALPVGRVDTRHLLVLGEDITADEVEALALSQDLHSGWVGASRLQLLPGAELQGPWKLDAELRNLFDLPPWAAQIMLLECEPVRSGPLPAALTGIDALSDAFPLAQPTGTELIALTRLRAIARRLAGALRLAGDPEVRGGKPRPVLLTPDPETSISLTVYAPVWIAPDAAATLVGSVAPGARLRMDAMSIFGPGGLEAVGQEALERLVATIGEDVLDEAWRRAEKQRREVGQLEDRALASGETIEEMRDGYAVVADVDPDSSGKGTIEVRVLGTDEMPLAVRGESWASGGVVSYGVVWLPRDPADVHSESISRVGRRARTAARECIERIARVIATAAHGAAVDDDGFLVALN